MWLIVLLSGIAGAVGTALGGIFGVLIGAKGKSVVACTMSVACGIMLAIVFCDLLVEAGSLTNDNLVVVLGFLWGIIIMSMTNKLIDVIDKKSKKIKIRILQNGIDGLEKKQLKKLGLFLVLAIALHNIPEGLAIGTAGINNIQMGVSLTVVILLHNVPEGMSIALPLVVSGSKKLNVIMLTFIAGMTTMIGGILGVFLGDISTSVSAFMLALAGGAMLQITLCDMLPECTRLDENSSIYKFVVLGVIIGFVVTNVV